MGIAEYLAIAAVAIACALASRWLVLGTIRRDLEKKERRASVNEASQARINAMLLRTGQLLQPDGAAETRTRIRLVRSGILIDPVTWRGIQAVTMLGALGLGAWCTAFFKVGAAWTVAVFGLSVAVGLAAPYVYLADKKKTRQKALANELPSALELLSTAVRSGYPLERGLRLVGEHSNGPLSEEFRRVDREMSLLSMPLEAALDRMKQRCDTPCITTFANALIHAKKQGTSVTRTLNAQADNAREQYYADMLVAVNQLPNKMVPVIFIVYFPIIIALSVVPVAYNAIMSLTSVL